MVLSCSVSRKPAAPGEATRAVGSGALGTKLDRLALNRGEALLVAEHRPPRMAISTARIAPSEYRLVIWVRALIVSRESRRSECPYPRGGVCQWSASWSCPKSIGSGCPWQHKRQPNIIYGLPKGTRYRAFAYENSLNLLGNRKTPGRGCLV